MLEFSCIKTYTVLEKENPNEKDGCQFEFDEEGNLIELCENQLYIFGCDDRCW